MEELIEAKRKAIADGAKYRRDFMDSENWDELAEEYGVTLPQWWVAPTPNKMRAWVRKLGLSVKEFRSECGDGWDYPDFAKQNPDWPLRVFVGILLEYVAERNAAREIIRRKELD